jgi:hypothetical protein
MAPVAIDKKERKRMRVDTNLRITTIIILRNK